MLVGTTVPPPAHRSAVRVRRRIRALAGDPRRAARRPAHLYLASAWVDERQRARPDQTAPRHRQRSAVPAPRTYAGHPLALHRPRTPRGDRGAGPGAERTNESAARCEYPDPHPTSAPHGLFRCARTKAIDHRGRQGACVPVPEPLH